MADALCGPSNPLQSFKNHSQIDRTLQQDRIAGARHAPTQGFRTPDPRAGSLDADFAAFEAGPQEPFHLQQQSLLPFHTPYTIHHPLPSHPQYVSPAPQWAADFQKLHLGSAATQPIPQNQFRSEPPLVPSNLTGGVGAWQNDFMRQHQQHSTSTALGKQALRSTLGDIGSVQDYPMSRYQVPHKSQNMNQEIQYLPEEGTFQNTRMDVADHAAFEAAFAHAEGSQISKQGHLHHGLSYTGEVAGVRLDPIFQSSNSFLNDVQANGLQYPENSLSKSLPQEEQQQPIRIGSDIIPNNQRTISPTRDQNSRDADELARTAGQLLSSVSSETSAKFEQSQFLALMRRIRDREVEVHGEEFRETNKNGDAAQNVSEPLALSAGSEAIGQKSAMDNPLNGYQQEMDAPEAMNSKRIHAAAEQQRQEEHKRQTLDMYQNAQDLAQPLHPGGRGYPPNAGQLEDPHRYDHWASGGLGAADVEEMIDESHGLASRFRKVSIEDGRNSA